MNSMKLKIFSLFALSLIAFSPNLSQAATVSSVAINENTAIFTIKYDFIAGKEDYLIPIGALASILAGSDSNFAGYRITSKAKIVPQVSLTSAITLSSQPVVDGLYYLIPAGERARFTLVVIATMDENTPNVPYYAELTHLPYFIGSNRTTVTDSRISRFVSDEVILKRGITGNTFTLIAK